MAIRALAVILSHKPLDMRISILFTLFSLMLCLSSCDSKPEPASIEEEPATTTEVVKQKPKDDTGIKDDYRGSDRLAWQRPDRIINLLAKEGETLEDKTVADIGAGTGYFTLRLAPKVEKVIALDIDPSFINYLDSIKTLQLPESVQDHLETRLTPVDRPQLEHNEIDAALIVNTFMFIENKTAYLKRLKDALVDTGRVVIVDFKRKKTPFGPPAELRLPLYRTEELLEEAGYQNIITDDRTLDFQYIVIADK